MLDKEFLLWLRDRLVNRYHEDPNTDFVLKLEAIASVMDEHQSTGPVPFPCHVRL